MGGTNGDYGTWQDDWNGVENPMQYNLNGDGTTASTQQQQSPLGGLAAMLAHYTSPQSGVSMPTVGQYGQQSLDVAPNSAFIDPASTDISF